MYVFKKLQSVRENRVRSVVDISSTKIYISTIRDFCSLSKLIVKTLLLQANVIETYIKSDFNSSVTP